MTKRHRIMPKEKRQATFPSSSRFARTSSSLTVLIVVGASLGIDLTRGFCVVETYHIQHQPLSVSPAMIISTSINSPSTMTKTPSPSKLPSTRLFLSSNSNEQKTDDGAFLDVTDDPFLILQLSSPTADAKEIRKAYRRMAVRFHPDVATNQHSTPAEKKLANDRFAKINWAYQTLSGKNQQDNTYNNNNNNRSGASSTASQGAGWTPPHRRSGSTSTSGTRRSSSQSQQPPRSTDWRDYMPNMNNEDDEYDTDGDSFSAIFSDLFAAAAGAASGASGSGGVLKDFVEFLEQEGGFGTSSSGSATTLDAELAQLLRTGSLEEVAEEMDDAGVVEQQLETKLSDLQNQIITLTADVKFATSRTEKMNFQEELAAVEARVKVVKDYLKQARKRLLALQTRYKELVARGGRDPKVGTKRQPTVTWDDIKQEASTGGRSSNVGGRASSSSSTNAYSTNSQSQQSSSSTTSRGSTQSAAADKDDAWKTDSFGSSGRGRGRGRGRGSSSRQRVRTEPTERANASSSTTSSQSPPASTQSYSSNKTPSSSSSYTPRPPTPTPTPQSNGNQSDIPPHRRGMSQRYESDDKRRLRELKVDDEFDKLKKELGL